MLIPRSSLDRSPFAGTARYYDRFRAPYARAALDFIFEAYDLSDGARVLDVGCGAGTVAIPLSHSVAEVVAVDPDADMISEAGPFATATIGQAFHWMDRDEVLRKLAILIADGGRLALVNLGKQRPQESWEPLTNQIIGKFLGPRARHPISNPQEPEHEPALRRSKHFSRFAVHEFSSTVTRDIN